MSIRSKSRKRLGLLLVSAIVVVGLLLGIVSMVKAGRDAARRERRQAGIAAVERGDYPRGLELLSQYLAAVPSDARALYYYAVARSKLPMKDRRHLLDASAAMYRAYRLDPSDRNVQQQLLELFAQAGGSTEALAVADEVLQREPDNVAAAYLRALALHQLRRLPEARQAAQRLVAAQPDHFEAHRLLLELLSQTGTPNEQLVETCRTYQRSHPDDPRFRLLMAMTYTAVGNRSAAAQELLPLKDWTPPSAALGQLLVGQFQATGNFDAALDALRRCVDAAPELHLRQELVRRLWETGHQQEALDRTNDLEPANAQTDAYLLGYRALALLAQKDKSGAAVIADALAARSQSGAARAWAAILKSQTSEPPPSPAAMLDVCRSASELDAENPLPYYLRGQAYAEMGEEELAIAAWNQARKLSPLWPQLYLRLAQSLLKVGRTGEALNMAAALHQLVPQDLAAAIVEARVWAAALREGQTKEVEGLLLLLDNLRQQAPADSGVLELQVQVLADLGRLDQARQVARQALETTPPPSPQTLAALARLNRAYDLSLDPKLLERAAADAVTPELALEMALRLHATGQDDQALACLQTPPTASSQQDALAWALTRAQYAQQTGSPDAAALFAQIADGYPQSLPAQQAVLNSTAAWRDLALIDRVIQRVQALGGESGLMWKLARARWYLARQESAKDTTAAIDLLESVTSTAPDTLLARLLLASAHEQLGNLTAAVDNLTYVSARRPTLSDVRLDLARLLYALGHNARAAEELEHVLGRPDLPQAQYLQAVGYLARHGDVARAAGLLEDFLREHPDSAPAQLLLAGIYRRQNQNDKTAQLCQQLLQKPSPAAVEFAADFYASVNQPDAAQAALDKLAQLDLAPGLASLIRANHALRHASADQAMQLLQQVVQEAPRNPVGWRALIALCLRTGKADQAAAAIASAAQEVPQPQGSDFLELLQQVDLIKRLSADATLRWLLVARVADEKEHRHEVLEALAAVDSAQHNGLQGPEVTRTLRQLADRYPRFLALQNTVASRYLAEGQPHLASDVASRAMQAFPDDAEPAWLAAEAFAAAGRWPEALGAAQQWRQRSSSRPLGADLLIAQARLRLNQPEAALSQIQPYLDQALENPDALAPVVLSHATALIASGKQDQAQAMLRPLMTSNARWRQAWIQLAVFSLTDPAAAADWLRQVQPHVPADAVDQQVLLARAWYNLGARSNNSEYRQIGKSMLENLAQRPNAGPNALLNLALALDLEQDVAGAERLYRQTLSLEPNQSVALNNLAMLLARQGGQQRLQEAYDLAQQAIQAAPDSAAYHDTLAEIQVRLKLLSQAAESLRAAVRLEPRNLQWQARLARVLQQNGQLQEAQSICASIKRLDPQLRDLTEEERLLVESLSRTSSALTEPASPL